MITLKNILVATDFSEASEVAMHYGRALARTFGVRTAPCPVLTVRHPEREFVVPDAADTTATCTSGGLS